MFCKCTVKPWSCDIFWGGYWTVPTIIKTQQVKDSAYFHNSLHSTNLKNLSSYLILDFYKTEELLKDRFRDDVSNLRNRGQDTLTIPNGASCKHISHSALFSTHSLCLSIQLLKWKDLLFFFFLSFMILNEGSLSSGLLVSFLFCHFID